MKKLFFLTLALAAAFACQKNAAPVAETTGNAVRFRAEIPNTYVLKSTALEGKKVRIAADATLDNATTVAIAEGNELAPETVIRWKDGQTDKTTFAGLYQELESGDAPAAPTGLKLDYDMVSSLGAHDYAYHSTFLTATAKNVTPETTVNLAFKHPFSKLGVTVSNGLTDGSTIKEVSLKNVVTAGTLDLAADAVTLGTDKKVVPTTVVDGKYSAIILPQTAKLAIYVTVTKDNADRDYAFTLTAEATFEANKSYTANVTLDDGTVEGEAVAFAFTVADWVDAGTLETEELVETHVWSAIGSWDEWNADIDLTETSDGVWEGDIEYTAGDNFKLRQDHAWDKSAGLKSGWSFYGLGEFADGYLEENSNTNIVLKADADTDVEDGTYHIEFHSADYRFIVTAVTPEP